MVSCEISRDRPAQAYTRDSGRGHGDHSTKTSRSLCRRMRRTLKAWMSGYSCGLLLRFLLTMREEQLG
jgi:hypothetical protein